MTRAPQITEVEAATELLRRSRMRSSLVAFAQNIVIPGAPVDGDDPGGWEAQAEALMQPAELWLAAHHVLLMEALQRCMTTRYGRLMVFMPPGSAKSTYGSSVGPAWFMGLNPGAKIMLVSFALELAKKHGRKARAIVQQSDYEAAFGARLSENTSAADLWAVQYRSGAADSEYMAGSFLSGLTGNRAAGVVIDDPVKGRKEADSPTVRKNVLEIYQDDLLTRLIPGAWVALIQTRWHAEDLAGSLLPENYNGESGPIMCRDGLVWEVLNLPAECERADDPLQRPIGDGMGGVPGSMLWEEWFEKRHFEVYRKNPRTWSALFQQRPRPENGGEFKRDAFRRYEIGQHPARMAYYVSYDFAVTDEQDGDDPDLTEIYGWGVDVDGKLWAVDGWYGRKETDVTIVVILNMAARWKARKVFGEKGVIRRSIAPFLRDLMQKARAQFTMEFVDGVGNKVAKAQSFRGLVNSGRVYIPNCEWGDRLIDQLCVFPGKGHDDGVDACSNIGLAVDQFAITSRPEEDEVPKEPRFGTWAYVTQDVQEGPPPPRVF